MCIFGSHAFVPKSWMWKKQTAVSHSSTESEIISLDTGLILDGLPALELWDLIVSVLGNVSRVSDRSEKPESDDHKHHKSHSRIDVMKPTKLLLIGCSIELIRTPKSQSNTSTPKTNSLTI